LSRKVTFTSSGTTVSIPKNLLSHKSSQLDLPQNKRKKRDPEFLGKNLGALNLIVSGQPFTFDF